MPQNGLSRKVWNWVQIITFIVAATIVASYYAEHGCSGKKEAKVNPVAPATAPTFDIEKWRANRQANLEQKRAAARQMREQTMKGRAVSPLGKVPSGQVRLEIYHGTDNSLGASTGTDLAVYKIFGDPHIHIEANCTVLENSDVTFWILDADTFRQFHILTVASYNISTGFIGDYYKDEYFPRSYCVSDIPCGVCSPSPGDHYNYICPHQVDTYYAEYPADTLGDYAFKVTVDELGRIDPTKPVNKNKTYIFGGHVVVDPNSVGCNSDGLCYKFVRDDAVVTPAVRNKLLNMK